MPLLGCATSVIIMIGLLGFSWMESYCYFFKLYRFNADIKYGDEYSFTVRYLQLKKEFPNYKGRSNF